MKPDKYTLSEQFISVDNGHKLYAHEWGNVAHSNNPIIFLHGGPGSGCHDSHKDMFDPTKQYVIFFDQRGAGKSLPKGSLENNTTDDLIKDINHIADHFKLQHFILTGGSWGSCLALAYGIAHPDRVSAMVLRGIYTGTEAESNYLDNGEFRALFPDVWDAYKARTPAEFQNDPSAYHYKHIFGADAQKAKESAYAYSELEISLISLDDRHAPQDFEDFDPSAMSIELHYLHNRCFLPADHIIKHAHKLTMPISFIQGRYDVVCPPVTAYNLHKKLPKSTLLMTIAGHSGSDRANRDAVKVALEQLTQS